MKMFLLILLALSMSACTGLVVKSHGHDVVESRLAKLEQRLERLDKFERCLNEDGQFDENIGYDDLDCGNL